MRSLGRATAAAAARCSRAPTSSLASSAQAGRSRSRIEAASTPSTQFPQRRQQHARALSSSGARARREDSYRLPSETDNRDLSAKVRESMRLIAQPMAIITTPVDVEADIESGAYGQTPQQEPLIGFVASSFNVVSMADDKGPIVSFNLKLPSRSFAAISECGRFDVSFPWSSEVCHSFLRPPPGQGDGTNTRSGSNSNNRNSGGAGGDYMKHNNGNSGSSRPSSSSPTSSSSALTPALNHQRAQKKQQSAIAHGSDTGELLRLHRTFAYRCEWLQDQSVTVADHVIMLGRVTDFVVGDLVNPVDVKADQLPINYRDAKFLKLKTVPNDPSFFEYSVKEKVL